MASDTSPRRARFVEEYLIDLNATQAAIRAGYSRGCATVTGHRLISDASIQAAISAAVAARSKRTEITADWVLREIAKIAGADVRKLYDDNGNPRHIHDLDDETAASIAGLEVANERVGQDEVGNAIYAQVRKFKRWDKLRALEMLGRHLALFHDKVEINVTHTLAERLDGAIARIGNGKFIDAETKH